MSFFEKFIGDSYKKNYRLVDSIGNQISKIFENRGDLYYSYNFDNKQIVPVHRLFRYQNLFDSKFRSLLKDSIKAVDPRIEDLELEVLKDQHSVLIKLQLKLKNDNNILHLSIKPK